MRTRAIHIRNTVLNRMPVVHYLRDPYDSGQAGIFERRNMLVERIGCRWGPLRDNHGAQVFA
jgi:hypothetical protein